MATKQSSINIGTELHVWVEMENHATLCSWSSWLAAHEHNVPFDDEDENDNNDIV